MALVSASKIISGNVQRKLFSGSPVLFSGSKGLLISHECLCEATKHLDCNSLMIHNGIRNKTHMYKGYMPLNIDILKNNGMFLKNRQTL